MLKKMLRYLVFMLRIRRVEFRIAEIPIIGIPVLLLAENSSVFSTFYFWEGVFIFFLLFAFGDMVNCFADRDLDAAYKPHLSESVYGLGLPFVKFQIWATAVLAVLLSLHLSLSLDRWSIAALTIIGLILGAAYSLEPVRLKRRGIVQLTCLWGIIFVGPILFVSQLISTQVSTFILIFAAVYGALQMGIILINTAEDYPEDLAAGVDNTIVRLGLKNGIKLAVWLTAAGAAGVILTLGARYLPHSLSVCAIGFLPLIAGCLFVLERVARLSTKIAEIEITDAISIVKTRAKFVPVWITITAWTTFWAAGVLFVYR